MTTPQANPTPAPRMELFKSSHEYKSPSKKEWETFASTLEQELTEKHNAFEKAQANYESAHGIIVQLRAENEQLRKVADEFASAWYGYKIFPSLANERQFADADAAYNSLPHVLKSKQGNDELSHG